jgi:Ni,Fe-hydrogenase III large subunit
MNGVGKTGSEQALRLGAVGVAARATGLAIDARFVTPAYPDLSPQIVTAATGDVAARFLVRLNELEESLRLIEAASDRIRGPLESVFFRDIPEDLSGHIVTYTESPHGINAHDISLSEGRVARYHIRSGTFRNWPLLAQAVAGNAVADFPLINKSFELCYSCTDR